jgi:hypothetical protein
VPRSGVMLGSPGPLSIKGNRPRGRRLPLVGAILLVLRGSIHLFSGKSRLFLRYVSFRSRHSSEREFSAARGV